MSEEKKEIERPFHVVGILDSKEGFHSGHDTIESAQSRCKQANEQAVKLGIRTRYEVREIEKESVLT